MNAIVSCYLLFAVDSFSKGRIHWAETLGTFSFLKAVTTDKKKLTTTLRRHSKTFFFIGRIHLNEKNEKKTSPMLLSFCHHIPCLSDSNFPEDMHLTSVTKG